MIVRLNYVGECGHIYDARLYPRLFSSVIPITRPRHLKFQSIKNILLHLPRHDHHPDQKHRPHDPKTKHRLPIIANPQRLQVRERGLPLALLVPGRRSVDVAVGVDGARGPVELDGGLDQAGEVEHEEDEAAEDDEPGEELPLAD